MIHAIDHVAVTVRSVDAAAQAYALLLGRRPLRTLIGDAAFQLANMRLVLRASDGDSEGLDSLVFAVRDLAKARRLLVQRALPVRPADANDGALLIGSEASRGVPIGLCEDEMAAGAASPLAAAEPNAAITGLDHVVIRSPHPERAIALYAGRLGLSLRLDRTEPAWGARLLFFRCGDLIVEVAHDLKAAISDGPDRLWGLSWRVPAIADAHARLRAGGVDVSDIRTGRRPGTQVFTVRSHTSGVPTLMIGSQPP
jgi:catechol 2,3-dioxygenase-like lactoylglutathione lyase family enzyme